MGSIINEKIKYIKLYIFQMAAQHCRIKIYSMDRYLLPGNKEGRYLARQPKSTKGGNK